MNPDSLIMSIGTIKQGITFPLWNYLIVLISAIVGSYFGSYLKRKGDNKAVREDLNIVTKGIEKIKAEFDAQNEFLKANLEVHTQSQNDLIKEKRAAYLNYFNRTIYWYHLCIDFKTEHLTVFDESNIKQQKSKLAEANLQSSLASDHLFIYNESVVFLETTHKFYMEILKVQHLLETLYDQIGLLDFQYKSKYQKAISEDQEKILKEYQGIKSELFEKHRNNLIEAGKTLFGLKNKMALMIGNILKNLTLNRNGIVDNTSTTS